MCAKLFRLCPDFCDPVDYSPPGSTVHGISRHEHWSVLPCLPPWYIYDPGIKPMSLCLWHWQVGSLPLVPTIVRY